MPRAKVWLVSQSVRDLVVVVAIRHGWRAVIYGCFLKRVRFSLGIFYFVERAITRETIAVWARLQEFAALGLPPKGRTLVGPRPLFSQVVSGVMKGSWPEGLYELISFPLLALLGLRSA